MRQGNYWFYSLGDRGIIGFIHWETGKLLVLFIRRQGNYWFYTLGERGIIGFIH